MHAVHEVTLVLGPAGFLGSNGEGPPKACWPWMTPPLPYLCRVLRRGPEKEVVASCTGPVGVEVHVLDGSEGEFGRLVKGSVEGSAGVIPGVCWVRIAD